MPEIALTNQVEDYMETYRYNSFNQLMQATIDGENTYYEYDANKERRLKRTGDSTTRFLTDGGTVVAETDENNVVKSRYYHGFGLISSESNGTTNYYLYDGHGNTTQLANASGTVTRDYSYDAFGNQLNADSNDTNPFRYCGEYYDTETGNIYLRARYYDPSMGRFISEDPARDGLNWYVYANNSPIRYIDPTGMTATTDEAYNVLTCEKLVLNTLAYYVGLDMNSDLSIKEVERQVDHLRVSGNSRSFFEMPYSKSIILTGFDVANDYYANGWNEGPGSNSYGITVVLFSLLEMDSLINKNLFAKDIVTGIAFETIFGFEMPEIYEQMGFSSEMAARFEELDNAVMEAKQYSNPYIVVKEVTPITYCLEVGAQDNYGNIVFRKHVFELNLYFLY